MKYELIYIPKYNWYAVKYGDLRRGGVTVNSSDDIYKIFDFKSAGNFNTRILGNLYYQVIGEADIETDLRYFLPHIF